MIGKVVSSYNVTVELGSGVYLAQDTELDRQIVIRFLPADAESGGEAIDQLVREAKTAARLHHPNLITVYKVGEHSGRPFAAMEYVEGSTLADRIAGAEMTSDEAVAIAIQICSGLAEAHKNGIFQRELSLESIFVDRGGRVRVANFPRPDSSDGPPRHEAKHSELSDVLSIGSFLRSAVTDDEYKNIIARAVSERPGDRYPSLDALADDLTQLRNRQFARARRNQSMPRWLKLLGVGAALAVAALAFIVVKPIGRGPAGSNQLERPVIAVLPFENLGDSSDEYFADGITDEITARLALMNNLGVISRTSSRVYKNTDKSIREIGAELEADYIIEGTIRWDKSRGKGRVRITPQLIDVSDDTNVWADTYEREITEIFSVQADIATQVARALDVTLLEDERRALTEPPTENVEAYQAYLMGMTHFDAPDFSRESFELSAQMFERAIALDPSFALALARLSSIHSRMYHYGYDRSERRKKLAIEAVERAFSLQPDLAEAHLAMGYFYYWVQRDYDRALASMDIARKRKPNSSEILQATAYVKRRQGDIEASAELLARDLELSPLDAAAAVSLGETYGTLRRYADAERALEHGIALAPDNFYPYTELALLYLRWRGDVDAARAALGRLPATQSAEVCRVSYLVELLDRDYMAALDLLGQCDAGVLEASTFFRPVPLLEGETLRLMDEPDRAQAAFEAARVMLEDRLAQDADDYRVHSALGITYAGLERAEDAVRHGERAVELYPTSRDALEAPVLVIDLALIYTMTGDYDAALERLDQVLSIPSILSAPWLARDPRWDPLRNHPGFERLLQKHQVGAHT